MTRASLRKHDFEHSGSATQVDSLNNSSVDHAFIAVAQEVAELLQQTYPVQTDRINLTETQLTKRELEVLQLMADGYSNAAIAQRLYITMSTVKTHARNIFSKLYVSDRTQAVILGFRSGLVH